MKYIFSLLVLIIMTLSAHADGSYNKNLPDPDTLIQQKSFEVLNEYFAQDDTYVYFLHSSGTAWEPISGIDTDTFEVVKGKIGKDINGYWNRYTFLEGVEGKIKVISGEYGYMKDENNVYGPKGLIDGADIDSFKVIGELYAIDISSAYYNGTKIDGAESGKFKDLNRTYAKDKNNVYYKGRILEGADPKDFKPTSDTTGKDDDYTYTKDQRDVTEVPTEEVITPVEQTTSIETIVEESEEDISEEPAEESSEIITASENIVQGLDGRYIFLYTILGLVFAVLLLLLILSLFLRKNGNQITLGNLTKKTIGIAGITILTTTLISYIFSISSFGIIGTIWYVLLAIFLVVLFYSLLASYIKSILLTLLVILIHATLFFVFVQIFGDIGNNESLISFFQSTKTLLNVSLFILPVVIGTLLLRRTAKLTYVTSFLRVGISTLLSILLLAIMQRFLGIDSVLASLLFFHIFFAIFLFILGMNKTDIKIFYLAQVLRVTFFHFIIVGLIIYIGSWILHF